MTRSIWATGTAAAGLAPALLASSALADPGPHHHQTAAQLLNHLLTDGFHVGHIVGVLFAVLAGLGLVAVIKSARSGFRR